MFVFLHLKINKDLEGKLWKWKSKACTIWNFSCSMHIQLQEHTKAFVTQTSSKNKIIFLVNIYSSAYTFDFIFSWICLLLQVCSTQSGWSSPFNQEHYQSWLFISFFVNIWWDRKGGFQYSYSVQIWICWSCSKGMFSFCRLVYS
jgi:hypothetical protein